jgi:hypothetical protein
MACGRRDIFYAIIHALGATLDDNLPFIGGGGAEIDRRIALNERRPSNRWPLPAIWADR